MVVRITVFSFRMEHFQGEYFDNLFLHYRPKGAWYPGQYQINRAGNYRGQSTSTVSMSMFSEYSGKLLQVGHPLICKIPIKVL